MAKTQNRGKLLDAATRKQFLADSLSATMQTDNGVISFNGLDCQVFYSDGEKCAESGALAITGQVSPNWTRETVTKVYAERGRYIRVNWATVYNHLNGITRGRKGGEPEQLFQF